LGAEDEEENPKALQRLCKDTGGVAFFPGPKDRVADISKEIAETFASSTHSGMYRKI
jgi:hypothetical protein